MTTRRLWSLWEMNNVDASAFHTATAVLQQAISLVQHFPGRQQMAMMSHGDIKTTKEMLQQRLTPALSALNIPITKLALSDAVKVLEQSLGGEDIQYVGCGQLLLNLSETLRRELTVVKVFALDVSRANFYESPTPLFGPQIQSKFPSLAYEIDQAGKCYACDLTTASAFHSIRCLEAGIRAITRCLGLSDPTRGKDRNWSNISRDIKAELDKRWPQSSGRMSGDAQLFDEIYGALVGMQNPYRNATMHLEAIYTAPEALHIFEVVKGLMQKIAFRMDEQGEPKV